MVGVRSSSSGRTTQITTDFATARDDGGADSDNQHSKMSKAPVRSPPEHKRWIILRARRAFYCPTSSVKALNATNVTDVLITLGTMDLRLPF